MTGARPTATVAVVGAGASGTLAAAHLAAAAHAVGRRLELVVIDPDPPGRGLAYATQDPRHRLNVPARGMSAWPDEPDHFVRWLRRHVSADSCETDFAARRHYGRYLADVLHHAVAAAPRVQLQQLALRATDVRRHGRRLRVSLSDGTFRPADAVVLALGHGEPSISWAPPELRRHAAFIADPWRTTAGPTITAGNEIVLVGAGLTAVDMTMRWAGPGVRIHMVSRHGMLPLAHAADPRPPAAAPTVDGALDLSRARRMVFEAIRATGGDWRRAVDGLRPVTSDLWRSLDDAQRRAFLTSAARRWDRVRHRIDPAVQTKLAQWRADGTLVVHAAELVEAHRHADRLRVRLSDATSVDAAAVVNCTGTSAGVSTSSDPLVMNLLASGLARPGPLDLGFATDGAGRLLPTLGDRSALWTLGPMRRGELWESTAIPEIRAQAAELAEQVMAALPGPDLRRRPRDEFGLPISAGEDAAAHFLEGVGRILRVQSGAERLVADATRLDPDFALGHAVRALLGVEWGVDVDVDAALASATAPSARADERERRFIEVAEARVREPGPDSASALLAYIDAYPEDALAVSLAVPTIAFGGATEIPSEAWALIDALSPAYRRHWWYLGMLAFTRQEQSRFAEAGELAAEALAIEPAAGHAVHAKAHVHYETGDHRDGLTWLDDWIATCGARASHRAHFSWHAALHELALGDRQAMARRCAHELAPPAVGGVRALVDSASLLWRAQAAGLPAGQPGIDAIMRTIPRTLLEAPVTPFIALHAAVALAAAQDCHGLARLRRHAEQCAAPVFARTVAPLTDALCDLVHGDFDRATDGLLALEGVDALGGSAAQREVVEDTVVYSAIRAGRVELARAVLTRRLERRDSPSDRARRVALDAPGTAVIRRQR